MRLLKKRRVNILGAGPTGLIAAHAAEERGWEVHIFTAPDVAGNPKKSELHGCQYLHRYIPNAGISGLDAMTVDYQLRGSAEGYRRKVYGDNWSGQVSPDEYGPERPHPAWDLRKMYDHLWERWEPKMSTVTIAPDVARAMAADSGLRGTILSTIPAKALCLKPDEHKFVTQDIWAMGSREDGKPYWTLPFNAPNFTVLCNGEDAPRWYRAATVFGHSTLEWPGGVKPPISGVARVSKPLSTDCDCHLVNRWHRLGRYGKWQKGVLVHQAYEEVLEL